MGSATSKWRTRAPAAIAAASTCSGSTPGVQLDRRAVHAGLDDPRPGHRRPATAAGGRPSTEIRTSRRPVDRRTSRSGPPTTIRPRSTIATDSHSASATSIWWVEKTTVRPRSRSSRNASRRSITLTGSRPVNGSSMSRTCGSCRTAAMNWIFCWLPLDSCSARRPARSSARNRREPGHRLAPGARPPARRGGRRRTRAGRGPASAGTGRAPRAGSPTSSAAAGGSRSRASVTSARVRLEHAERDPHRRRLARAVRAEEPEHLARAGPRTRGRRARRRCRSAW